MEHTGSSTQTHTAASPVTWEPPGLGLIMLSEIPDTTHSSLPSTVRTSRHWEQAAWYSVTTPPGANSGSTHRHELQMSSHKLQHPHTALRSSTAWLMYAINSYAEKDRHSVDYSLYVCVCFEWGGGLMLIPKLSRPAGTCGSDEGCMTAELSTFPYWKGSWVQATGWEAVVLATQGSLVCCSPTEKVRTRPIVHADTDTCFF